MCTQPGSNLLVQNLDIAPTLLDIAGVSIPEDMQGESLVKTWESGTEEWRDAIYYHYYEKSFGATPHYGIRTERYKLIHFCDLIDSWELYDLEKDPSEMTNLIMAEEYSEQLKIMKTRLLELQEKYKDSPAD